MDDDDDQQGEYEAICLWKEEDKDLQLILNLFTGWAEHHLQLGQTSWEPSRSLCGSGDFNNYVHQQTRTAGRFKANEYL